MANGIFSGEFGAGKDDVEYSIHVHSQVLLVTDNRLFTSSSTCCCSWNRGSRGYDIRTYYCRSDKPACDYSYTTASMRPIKRAVRLFVYCNGLMPAVLCEIKIYMKKIIMKD